jgi:hypothetical protein
MFNRIRSLRDQGDTWLGGTVEMDKAYFGGKDMWKHESKTHAGRGPVSKTTVACIAQRGTDGCPGKVAVKVADGSGADDLLPHA